MLTLFRSDRFVVQFEDIDGLQRHFIDSHQVNLITVQIDTMLGEEGRALALVQLFCASLRQSYRCLRSA